MELPGINASMGSKMAMQALNLVRDGRLQRRKYHGRFVYFTADPDDGESQIRQREGERVETSSLSSTIAKRGAFRSASPKSSSRCSPFSFGSSGPNSWLLSAWRSPQLPHARKAADCTET